MSEVNEQPKSFTTHIILAVVVVLIIAGLFFWLSDDPEPEPVPVVLPEPIVEVVPEPVIEEPVFEPEIVEEQPELEEPLPAPEPIVIDDAMVKTSILDLTNYEAAASLLVNDDLLQRFVVLTDNMAKGNVAPQHQLLNPPTQDFRVYQQAGKQWIDSASYQRYTKYVDSFDEMDTEMLVQLYDKYKPTITEYYAEIGDPDDDFSFVIIDAINHLLDTPEVPVPVEVYSDSVMYKFSDSRLEELSGPQKHLLRMGPENMRRIKAKLREIKSAL
jgi:hypothetical protein